MNINAPNQPRAAVAAAAAQELSGEEEGSRRRQSEQATRKGQPGNTQNRAAPSAAAVAAAAASRCPPRRNWQPHFPVALLPAPLHSLAYTLPPFPPLCLFPGPACCCSSSAFAAVGCAFCLFFCTSPLYRIYQLIKIRAFYIYKNEKTEKNEYILRIYWCRCRRTRKWHFIAGPRSTSTTTSHKLCNFFATILTRFRCW